MEIVFATHNANKLKEVQQLLPKHIELLSLDTIGCTEDIQETATTLEGNAKIKANYITRSYGYNCFADDTGLEVEALNGAPGVFSARYAGEGCTPEDNIQKLLAELNNISNRNGKFRTVVVLNLGDKQYTFEGTCEGAILNQKQGEQGFGYDPIFKPTGYHKSFAEMTMKEKGKISHRGKAIAKLIKFLTASC